jgi:hypothetical protein
LIAPKPARRGIAVCPSLVPSEAVYDPVQTGRRPPPGWDWVGGNFAIRRRLFDVVGPFDECLGAGASFPAGEDTDYKLRLEALGIKMRSTPRSVVSHSHGYRYGLRAALRSSRNYATGNGGLAGKLTLLGDPRGREWVVVVAREAIADGVRKRQPHRLPVGLLRFWHYARSYRRCLRQYCVDNQEAVLRRSDQPRRFDVGDAHGEARSRSIDASTKQQCSFGTNDGRNRAIAEQAGRVSHTGHDLFRYDGRR